MNKILLFFWLLICNSGSVIAAPIIQDSWNSWTMVDYAEPIGQSFISEEEKIDYIAIALIDINNDVNDSTMSVSLYQGEGINSSNLLFSSEVNVLNNVLEVLPGDQGHDAWYTFFDTSSISFNVGESYTFAFHNNSFRFGLFEKKPNSYALTDNIGNPYLGGMEYFKGDALPEGDLMFRVVPAPVPLAATVWMFASGILTLLFAKVRITKPGKIVPISSTGRS